MTVLCIAMLAIGGVLVFLSQVDPATSRTLLLVGAGLVVVGAGLGVVAFRLRRRI